MATSCVSNIVNDKLLIPLASPKISKFGEKDLREEVAQLCQVAILSVISLLLISDTRLTLNKNKPLLLLDCWNFKK